MDNEGSRARAARNAPGFGAALGALADMLTGAARGATKATLGWPGDLERLLADQLPEAARSVRGGAPLSWNWKAVQDALAREAAAPTVFPTMGDVDKWLPQATQFAIPREQNAFEKLTEWTPLSPGQAARAVAGAGRASKAAAVGALERAGATVGRRGSVGQRGAIRTKGGNFDDYSLGAYLSERGVRKNKYASPNQQRYDGWEAEDGGAPRAAGTHTWAEKQLANYLRKEIGSPSDPLLAVERELPNLHLSEDALQESSELARMMNGPEEAMPVFMREEARLHKTLSSQPITPWGFHSDAALRNSRARALLDGGLSDEFDYGTFRADGPEDFRSLNETQRRAFFAHPENTEYKKFEWMLDQPDAPVISMRRSSIENDGLGFGHVLDYLDAAQSHSKTLQEWGTPQMQGVEAARLLGDAAPDYVRRALAFHDAGLTLAPDQLSRLSVADAVRKTAAWNEFMGSQGAGVNADLARGIARVHKEYPEEGMRWVELGEPETPFTAETLPKGYALRRIPEDRAPLPGGNQGYDWGVYEPGDGLLPFLGRTPEDALDTFRKAWARDELKAGLNAEGDVMGHCVGGYCDRVLKNGTRIFSLRDKNNAPHVTVEVGPGADSADVLHALRQDVLGRLGKGEYMSASDNLAAQYVEAWRQDPAVSKLTPLRWMAGKMGLEVPPLHPEIRQIKGKGNRAPVDRYARHVQDFVRSGEWGRVDDLANARLRHAADVFNDAEQAYLAKQGRQVPKFLTFEEAEELQRLFPAPADGLKPRSFATGGFVAQSSHGEVNSPFERFLAAGKV